MKKNLVYLVAAMATASMAITSCGNDSDQVVSAPKEAKTIDIYAHLNGAQPTAPITRAGTELQATELNDWTSLGVYVFKSGKVAATNDYAGYQNIGIESFEINDMAEEEQWKLNPDSSIYFPFDQSAVDVYLYAPRTETPSTTIIENKFMMNFLVANNQDTDSAYIASDFIYGMGTAALGEENGNGAINVGLKHALSKIIFKLEVEKGLSVNGISTLKMSNIQKKCAIALADGTVKLATTSGTKGDLIVAKVEEVNPYDFDDEAVYNAEVAATYERFANRAQNGLAVILPPQKMTATMNQPQIMITMGDKTAKADLKDLGTLQGGKVYTVKLKIEGNKVTISVLAITDWVDGGTTELTMSKFE